MVERLGAAGDGIAEHAGRRLFIPGALPGERLTVRIGPDRGEGHAASVVDRLSEADTRTAPACRHFGRCGGCALQHLAPAAYAGWKRSLVIEALSRLGLADAPVEDVLVVPPGDRRRAVFTAIGRKSGPVLGFAEARSHAIVDVLDCPVISPALLSLVPPLRPLLGQLLGSGERGQAIATLTASGVDLLLEFDRAPALASRERLAALATEADLARLAWRRPRGTTEILAERRPVRVGFDGMPAVFPPGAFLQASLAGEGALIAEVLAGIEGSTKILDLYAGIGTFTLPMSRKAKVTAMEGDAEAAKALSASAAAHAGTIAVERRDLARNAPDTALLDRFDAVVFDPPRAGARAVAEALARSSVKTAVAVSCNPQTFARDARILVDGGFRLCRVRPIDQFLWSPHIELAAHFRREAP
ncbi:MAG: 23S rRNA (uracil(1939)-C(5))-methyltransferase RlmD [Alphaproteobacteria bacterium]|nr:23S rRNA (uracil(1939)-C(5))-methyltransferase RlmD [Alphaproteobacteria bacterium]